MENKLDQLFRNQLSKHAEEPSPQSWEQMEEMLASKRRAVWTKRLAIAASITVFAAATIFAYQSLTIVQTDPSTDVANIEANPTNKAIMSDAEELSGNAEVAVEMQEDADTIEATAIEKSVQTEPAYVAEAVEKENSNEHIKSDTEAPSVVAEVRAVEEDIDPIVENNIEKQDDDVSTANVEEEASPVLAENATSGQKQETTTIDAEEKPLPKVQIVYKADRGSALVASSKNTIIDKGLNKITEFSDEHLLTADRKTRLRNTKNDLLALNFGKLLNKSNRELEN